MKQKLLTLVDTIAVGYQIPRAHIIFSIDTIKEIMNVYKYDKKLDVEPTFLHSINLDEFNKFLD